jgi:trk system potassium uptake protein TrkH
MPPAALRPERRVVSRARPLRLAGRSDLGVDVVAALNLVGSLMKPLGVAYLLPVVIAIGYGERVWPFVVSGAVTSGSGFALEKLTHGKERVASREGYLVVALLWLLVAVFGSLPYLLDEPQLSNPIDAFFESMSGFSSGGATVLADIEALPRSTAMWRQFTAWIGGLGIIVLFLAVLPRLNVGGRQALFRTEMPGPEMGLEDTIRATARRFMLLYVSLTGLEIAILLSLGLTGVDDHMTPFRAVAHGFSTVAAGGLSTEARSIEPFAAPTQYVIAVFMLVAGTNFALLYLGVVRHRIRVLVRDEEFRAYVVLVAIASAVVFVDLSSREVFAGEQAFRHAIFNTIAMMTTTGFASTDWAAWPPMSILVLFGVVILSASAGSASGSVKLVRHVVLAKMLHREVRQTVHPELVTPLRLNGNVVDERTLRAIVVFVLLYLGVLVLGAVIIELDASLRGAQLSTFEALVVSTSALGGAGPGLGAAGPMGSYAGFSDVSKLVVTAEMYLGRLEIVPVLVLLARSYWRR